MAIIRSKRQAHYTVIDNRVFAKNQLSFEAMGLLAYLLSKPDNWTVSIAELIGVTENTRKQSKTDAVYAILKELIEKGFVERKKHQSGKLDYIVYDRPQTGKTPNGETPKQGNSQIGKIPTRENPALNKYGNKEVINTELPPYPQNAEADEKQNCANALADGKPSAGGECAKSEKQSAVPAQAVLEAYNAELGDMLPKAQLLTDARRKAIGRHWREMLDSTDPKGRTRYTDAESGVAWWRRFFRKVKSNPHWLGGNDRGWRADLDWLLKPVNFVRVLEYTPKKGA